MTAAGQGIGRAAAVAFAREGAQALATDRDQRLLELLKEAEPSLDVEQLDVCDAAAIDALARRVGRIDVLFNCVGVVHHGSILECSEAQWSSAIEVNVTSMYRMIRAFLPGMLTRKKANIINVASVVSSIRGAPDRFAYGSSKAAVIGLTKSIAADFVTQGVRCNAICPGTVLTPSLEGRLAALGDYDQARQKFTARQPMGRLGTPEEVAHLAVYLASDESDYVTGGVHTIDGGWTI